MQGDHPAFRGFADTLLRATAPLTPAPRVMQALAEAADLRVLAKGDHLLRIGEPARHVFYVVTGLLRYYYLDPATGTERTGQFFDEGRVMTDAESYLTGAPATQSIDALEPAEILRLPREALLAAYEADHAVERYGRLMVEQALTGSQRRAARLLTLSPDERYRTFVATRPEVARRVPQYLIASYLGITPEGLSRIRGRAARRPVQD